MLPPRHFFKLERREALFRTVALLAGLISAWQLVLHAGDNSFLDGICAALGTQELAPQARALRLFRWTSAHDDGLPPVDPAGAPPARGLWTARVIAEHPAYFQANCGSKVRLLTALAWRAGLEARELRLCDSTHATRHVLCELLLGGRWAVFDPTIGLEFRRGDGHFATAAELRDPALLAANAARAPRYDLRYWRFDHAERLHFERLPLLGGLLRRLTPRLTGRPAEEVALPPAFDRPRLVVAGNSALFALLALAASGSTRRERRAAEEGLLDHSFQPGEPVLKADRG